MAPTRTRARRTGPGGGEGVGDRVRALRLEQGLSQSELAAGRFSKEYVSQIERGRTRPSREALEWLASRLGVDPGFLLDGVSRDARARLEAAVARAEALNEAERFDEALDAFTAARTGLAAGAAPDLELRAALGESRALIRAGRPREAIALLTPARALAEQPAFGDLERAEVLLHLGVARYQLSSIATAVSLLDEALRLADASGLPADRLRSDILHWRSRCRRRQRDYDAAREDVEVALELALGLDDARRLGHLYFQASLLAERGGQWVLARGYAEQAKAQYEHVSDRQNVGRLLNNLGGLTFLLGKPDEAVRHLKDAFAAALEVGSEQDAAQAVSSLAQVHLRSGEAALAEEQARHALALLGDREDWLDEIGNAHLVLGRALLEQDRIEEAEDELRRAETALARLSSASHRAAAWLARGDLAARKGDDSEAARLYRAAAEALQDVRF